MPLHVTSYYLNPELQYFPNFKVDTKVKVDLLQCIQKNGGWSRWAILDLFATRRFLGSWNLLVANQSSVVHLGQPPSFVYMVVGQF